MIPRSRRLPILLLLPLLAAPALADPAPAPLHPAVGDTLDAAEAARWGLYGDVPALEWVVFRPAAAGGFTAVLRSGADPAGTLRERNVPRDAWEAWRAALDAGERIDAARPPVDPDAAVWPEVPLPPVPEDAPPARPDRPDAPLGPPPSGWALLVDTGWKHATTEFGDYFTDMLTASIALGRPIGRVTPFLGFQTGFGDLPDDFETVVGDGRSAHYGVEAGLRLDLPLGDRHDLVLSGAGGYYMRSLRWGGTLFWTNTAYVRGSSLVREMKDWGGAAAIGLRRSLSPERGRQRHLEIKLRYERFPADPSLLRDPVTGAEIRATDRDAWLGLTVGLVLGI